jgi:twinkle protein
MTEHKQDFIKGHVQALEARGITEETCAKWGYEIGDYKGQQVHIANYRNDVGQRVMQKLRTRKKEFLALGDGKHAPLYGQWLWGSGGKYLCVTEGEIDALSMSQAMSNKWPVVSLPHGAQSAAKELGKHGEWLDTFDHVVLCFDMDKVGRAAIEEAARVLPPGKVKVMNLPEKDANAVLLKRGPQVLVDCFWKAKDWRPDGIVAGSDITRDSLKKAVAVGYELPLPKLNSMIMGLRKGELTLMTAGSGIGKSTLAREWAYLLATQHNSRIGNVFLEESNAKTVQGYVAIHHSVPLKDVRANPAIISDQQWDEALAACVHGRMWFYDHFGSLESTQLLGKLRYLAVVEKVDFIFLDHISIVVSGTESSQGERKDIDVLMTRLRSLVEETGVGVCAICHLNQPEGKAHEEGARVTLRHLRGSGGLKQLSDNVIALERDQQGDKPTLSLVRVLKCRETGETGEADLIEYDRKTGRLIIAPEVSPFDPIEDAGTEEIPF